MYCLVVREAQFCMAKAHGVRGVPDSGDQLTLNMCGVAMSHFSCLRPVFVQNQVSYKTKEF